MNVPIHKFARIHTFAVMGYQVWWVCKVCTYAIRCVVCARTCVRACLCKWGLVHVLGFEVLALRCCVVVWYALAFSLPFLASISTTTQYHLPIADNGDSASVRHILFVLLSRAPFCIASAACRH